MEILIVVINSPSNIKFYVQTSLIYKVDVYHVCQLFMNLIRTSADLLIDVKISHKIFSAAIELLKAFLYTIGSIVAL